MTREERRASSEALSDVDLSVIEAVDLTRAHYEAYPFVSGGERRVAHWSRRLRPLLSNDLVRGSFILDIGCGSGEVAQSLSDRGANMCCLDLTRAALNGVRDTSGGTATSCQASALQLPFRDDNFDHVISIGVLHHTPDCKAAFVEALRVTKPGGRLVILLYSRWTPYHALYKLTAPLRRRVPVRNLERLPHWTLHPIRLATRLATGLRHEDDQLRRLLADQFWTPQATFHSARQIARWANQVGAQVSDHKVLHFHANILAMTRVENGDMSQMAQEV